MRFAIRATPSADQDLDWYSAREQQIIFDTVMKHPEHDADVETRRRKRLRPNAMAPWELTIGRYRVFL